MPILTIQKYISLYGLMFAKDDIMQKIEHGAEEEIKKELEKYPDADPLSVRFWSNVTPRNRNRGRIYTILVCTHPYDEALRDEFYKLWLRITKEQDSGERQTLLIIEESHRDDLASFDSFKNSQEVAVYLPSWLQDVWEDVQPGSEPFSCSKGWVRQVLRYLAYVRKEKK